VDVELTIGGSGAAKCEISRAINAGSLGDRVRLAGAVSGDVKQRLWDEADVFAFPTYHREGLPYALLEAMAAGAVPVVTPVGAIPDVMQHEVHGLFVPAHDPAAVATALERLARDRPLLHRLALAARKRVTEQYSVARLAEELGRVYAQLAN
jgi:glycosyltransferase involved in cell wall biosynthesis